MVSPDRDRGILSQADREYLQSDKSGYSRQAQNKRDTAICDRFRNAIIDFRQLFEDWDRDEREDVFLSNENDEDFFEGVISMIALLYLEFGHEFETILDYGVNKAEKRMANSNLGRVDVELKVTPVEQPEFLKAIKKFNKDNLERMTDAEARAILILLSKSELIDEEDLKKMRSELLDEVPDIEEELPSSISRFRKRPQWAGKAIKRRLRDEE